MHTPEAPTWRIGSIFSRLTPRDACTTGCELDACRPPRSPSCTAAPSTSSHLVQYLRSSSPTGLQQPSERSAMTDEQLPCFWCSLGSAHCTSSFATVCCRAAIAAPTRCARVTLSSSAHLFPFLLLIRLIRRADWPSACCVTLLVVQPNEAQWGIISLLVWMEDPSKANF